ncbi:MAG TPA: PAS domain S-box protein [Verrucomicrobiae bacterium]|nr:PAS domain S-box protein [Verrucomicrobiae bacterium]
MSAIPEEVLRALLDAVPDATLAADASGRVVFANQSAASLFGYRPQELIGIAIASLVPEVSPRVGVRRDGSTFRALIDGERPEETPGFALFRVRESKPDVRLEDVLSELRISEERIRFILDSLPGMVFVADTTGGNTFTNRNFQTYTGLSEEKLLAHGWMDVLHPDDRARAARTWYACVRTGNAYEAEYRYRRHDGAYRWHLCRGLPLRDAAGKVTAWYGVCADIEDYKRAEFDSRTIHHSLEEIARERTAQLRQSEERYRTLISGIKDYAILMLDREGHVASWNECAQRTKGYSAEEILGKDFACFYTPEDIARDHPREMLRSAARDGHYEEDGWRVRKDGSRFWANVSLTAMRSATGELTGFSKVTRDITDRLLAEERLKAERQRAEDANRSKSDFLAAMSHEIRTPMNAILGMSDLLWESDLSEEQRKYVEVFRRAGSNLLILINDILDLSKIESGHFELEKAPFDLTEVVDQVIELLRPRARKKGIAMSAEIVPGTQTALIGDATRLRQVLTNLLGNAVKFTETGEVRLEVRAASAEPGDLDFMVSDTGIGIAPDKLEVIFQDFTQADSSTTRHYGGTGLGLSISRRIVNLMGGTLQAASTLGKGSTFRFRARLMVNPAEKSVEPQGITDIHGRRALVVDDSATNRLILHETLAAWGMTSREYASVKEGLADLLQDPGRYDLVILDRNMPEMDGFQAAGEFLRAAATPIVMLTSETVPGDSARWRLAGLSGYGVKPVKRAELLRIVCQAMKRAEPPAASAPGDLTAKNSDTAKPLRLLVAEDSPDNQLLVKAYLKGSPHHLTFVEDGKAAVEQFAAGRFDLILMDIQMPVMDGLAATRMIRAREAGNGNHHVPIIALTAHATPKAIETSREAGCDMHITKPISKPKLLEAIARCVPRGAGQQPISIQMPEGIETLVPQYLAERRAEVADIQAMLAASDFARIAWLAHNIKGTGLSYGFADLTRIGRDLELAAKAGDRATLRNSVTELSDYLSRVELEPMPDQVA